ncbi:hypothetical protein H8356DRAFT_1305393 [Neocallimastix lanati (nom. inval.)]|nr:hypothetical protein H8356DRAFT_1305393 [Neocallimastix sp. JGI-2020a]
MIHPQLAKEMGLKTEDRPLTFTTAAGKVLIPQVMEEFKIKIKLVEERTGKVKWYDFNTRCRLAEAMPRTIILGSRFMDRHLIYRKIDVHDQQPKVYKIDGERPGLPDVDSPEECAGESIYMVQLPEEREEAVQKEIQPTARITKIINQVIDNQKLKDTVYELTRQYYRDRGIEYTMDYYDYLVDYDKWADWFKVQKTKNLKESEINKNPTESSAQIASQTKDHLAMISQEDSEAETIRKVGLEKLLQIRWQELFATYWFEIVYRPGKKNGKADALSRVETEKTEGKKFDKDSLLKPEQLFISKVLENIIQKLIILYFTSNIY